MKRIAFTGIIASAFLFGTVACNQDQGAVEDAQETNEQMAEDTPMEDVKIDQSDFMTRAASSSMLEIEAGKLAQEKGMSQQVKDYGKKMVADHTKASTDMKALAAKKSVVLPDSMSNEHMEKLNDLREKTGAEFDESYADLMVSSHEEAVSLFEDASNNQEDAEVKTFATTTLPVLRQHLDHAKKLDESMNKGNDNASTPRN
ncbi:DUF4142 domain-containing protein [Pontibacter arcticus]|uniref:DUF4142 domain-containing protein n=1 Tax=Pontibacter arcticus TaxID=2080288 RepID=A0A364RIM6_9BACT|nr:DUF4142 domain-containing protein [Pontibacter arcticus]RAU84125.1 DUF4142 domain-containing protein [Pontibacter arcticus]